jgi:hypothetical protein
MKTLDHMSGEKDESRTRSVSYLEAGRSLSHAPSRNGTSLEWSTGTGLREDRAKTCGMNPHGPGRGPDSIELTTTFDLTTKIDHP